MRRLIQRSVSEPLWLIGALWPLTMLVPYVPGLPRPTPGGLPWRQEAVIALLLSATLAFLIKHLWRDRLISLATHRDELLVLLPLGLFTLWNGLSALWAARPYQATYQALIWGTYLLFFVLMRRVVNRPRILRASFYVLGVVIWMLSLACMVSFWAVPTQIPTTLNSLFRYFSGFSEMMVVAIPIFAALALSLRRPRRALLCGATAILAWIATLQALERAPIISAIAALLILAAGMGVKRNCRPRSLARAALLVAAFILATLLQAAPLSSTDKSLSAVNRLQSTTAQDANLHVRFLYWGIGLEMLRARPLIGVGANNYEVNYSDACARFSARHLTDPRISMNEDLLIRWAHSEYVQILAELGLVGLALFVLFAISLTLTFWHALRRSTKPLPALGAGAGMFAFALSSATSVCSFQWLAGGLMFFFGAAIISHFAAPLAETSSDAQRQSNVIVISSPVLVGFARVGALSLALVMLLNTGVRAMNATLEGTAQMTPDPVRAEQLYRAALTWDGSDATTHYNYGILLYYTGRASEAIEHLRYGVESGLNEASCFAYLAAAEAGAGDLEAAERTLAYAANVYPRSVFMRVRHATALAEIGKMAEAEKEYAAALAVNERAARGWQQLINSDVNHAGAAARRDSRITPPGELFPESCMWAVVAENKRRTRTPVLIDKSVSLYAAAR